MLCFAREQFPTHRVDVDVLFGRELIGRGNDIDFVMQADSELVRAGPHEWYGRTVHVGRTYSGSSLLGRVAKQCLGIWHDLYSLRLAVRKNYDAIQVRDKFMIALAALAIARARGLKFFFWLSFPFPEDDMMRARAGNSRCGPLVLARGVISGWLLYRWILPKCDHAFVQSERMKDEICGHGIDAEKLTPVPMGVAAADAHVTRVEEIAQQRDALTLGYLGTLDANRQLGILVEMLAELKRLGIVADLLLIGDASEAKDRYTLEQLAIRLGVERQMTITGFLPRSEAMKRIRAADICLSPIDPSPIFRVGSPTKLVEYLAVGLPVVANNHPEQKLILGACRAGVCVPWSARHFARGVRWLTRRTAAERAAMGEKGRLWVQANRTYSNIANVVEQKYIELLSIEQPKMTALR